VSDVLRSNASFAFAAALFEQLVRTGVTHVCVSPGSRSAPLAVAAAATPGLRAWSHLDERSAGFFALGLARATRAPVALVCTSGTAAANFAPSVAEAAQGRVPLVVLTADRPPELRDWGAGQTIRQLGIFGAHLRWSAEAPVPEPSAELLRHARALACRAADCALGPPAGPVHLNLPFREPLHPEPVHADELARIAVEEAPALAREPGTPHTRVWRSAAGVDPELVEQLAAFVRATPRGALVCGPWDADPRGAEALVRLARAAGWPLLPDALANLRGGPHTKEAPLVASYDALLRDEALAARLSPERLLRFGDSPTSKALRRWRDAHPGALEARVDPDGAWHDPSFRAAEAVRAEPAALADALARALEAEPAPRSSAWLSGWLAAESRAQAALARGIDAEPRLFEPRVVREIAALLPEDGLLFVSNSLPVRDADAFLPVSGRRLRVLGNRGANGIDGIVSSALGAAAGQDRPAVLLTGDLALLHDLGGLLAARRHGLRLAIVVIQNGGGGIFDLLPIARFGEAVAFEEHFTTPQQADLRAAAATFGLGYERGRSGEELRAALEAALYARRTTLIEVPVERAASLAHRRALFTDAAAAAREVAP
jgi:2-succinyl-5-enolpyruvyl-6-hydroxy-3-cyclohexene-1-carboxylate synthase